MLSKVVPLAIGAAAFGRLLRRRSTAAKAAAAAVPPKAPVANRYPHKVQFGFVPGENRGPNPMTPPIERDDDLFWLRDDDRRDPAVLSYLREENAHTESHLLHLKPLVGQLYDEIVGSILQDDDDLEFSWGEWTYFVRTTKGKAYPVVLRNRVEGGNSESNIKGTPVNGGSRKGSSTVVLDVNEIAKNLKYCSIGTFKPSPCHSILAYSVDSNGYETYDVKFKDLETGKAMSDVLMGTSGAVSWGRCSVSMGKQSHRTVFYSTQDDAHRVDKVWMHVLGTDQASDVLMHHEQDELFDAGFGRSADGKFMVIESQSGETNEVRVLRISVDAGEGDDATEVLANLELLNQRRLGHRCYPEHRGDQWFILSNKDAKINFDLYRVRDDAIGDDETWEPVQGIANTRSDDGSAEDASSPVGFPYSERRTLESICAFENFLVLEGRENGFSQIWVLELSKQGAVTKHHRTKWAAENGVVYTATASASLSCVGANQIFDTNKVFVAFSSLTSPKTVYEYDMARGTKTVAKRTPVLGFDDLKYATARLEVTARDGTKIPVSLAWKKVVGDDVKGGQTEDTPPLNSPVLLSGYGSYGVSCDPSFSREDVPLLDRGVVIAVAHVRGGGELGKAWYETHGKYLTKKNTFFDFVDVASCLVEKGYTSADQLAITGRSAGGLLIGASLNLAPELFKCAVAAVPFVDVMVSMCDASIPLTTGEWEEWGNPNEMRFFPYMLSYSPMENIEKNAKYPDTLITSGLFDPRVAYWEGTKYAVRLREACANHDSRILLKTDLDSGHFSASDRYKFFKEKAYEHAFVLDSLGLSGVKASWVK